MDKSTTMGRNADARTHVPTSFIGDPPGGESHAETLRLAIEGLLAVLPSEDPLQPPASALEDTPPEAPRS